MYGKTLIILFLFSIFSLKAGTRYVDSVFSGVGITPSVKYRTAADYKGNQDSLLFDFYEPAGDTLGARPLVLVFHGGAFIEGLGGRSDDFSATTADYLAKKGYAAASVEYRCGYLLNTPALASEANKAAYRAIQDARAAVRFFRANAVKYKIDTSDIFLCGYSAGGIISFNYLHLTDAKFLTQEDTSGLGSLESGDNASFSSSVKGSIAFAGAVLDTNWITPQAASSICFHGTADATVPYESGYAFGIQTMPYLFGSGAINRVSQRIGYENDLVSYQGKNHDFVSSHPLLYSSLDSAAVFMSSLMDMSPVINPHMVYKRPRRNAIVNSSLFDLSGKVFKGTGNSSLSHMYICLDRNHNGIMSAHVKLAK